MARSFLFKERTAGVPERLLSCHVSAFTEVSADENREFPCAGPTRSSTPYSPHIDPRTASTARVTSAWLARRRSRRPEGALRSTSTDPFNRHLQPTLLFSKTKTHVSCGYRFTARASPSLTDEPLGITPSRLTSSVPRLRRLLCSVLCHTRPARPSPMTPRHLPQRSSIPEDPSRQARSRTVPPDFP
jgi:hypothetical protein